MSSLAEHFRNLPPTKKRAASAGLFPSRINCKSVSSLIFFFAMDTSWKHHGNFWFTAVIARLSLKMRTINILHSTTRAAKRDREVRPAVRGRRAKAEESGLRSHLASFRPERALFRPGGVNLRVFLCGVHRYASAQPLDFLASTKNASFPTRKLQVSHPGFPDGH